MVIFREFIEFELVFAHQMIGKERKMENPTNQRNTKSQSQGTQNRGFASMDPERQREIASQGGKASHAKGTAHEFTSEEARKAGSQSHKNR